MFSADVIDRIGSSLSSFAPYLLIILLVLLAVIIALIIGIIVIKYKNSKVRDFTTSSAKLYFYN